MDHLIERLIDEQPLRLLRGQRDWDEHNTPMWSLLLNLHPGDLSPRFQATLPQRLSQMPPGELRGLLQLSLMSASRGAPERTDERTETAQLREDLRACRPGGVPCTLLGWALLDSRNPALREVARDAARRGELAPRPPDWAGSRSGSAWAGILRQKHRDITPGTLIWLTQHSRAEHHLRAEVILRPSHRVSLLPLNIQAAYRDFVMTPEGANMLLLDWQADRNLNGPQLHLISEPVPVARWPLKPDTLDWLWCWHDLAPHLTPGELAGRSVVYPLASHHVAGRQGEARRDHLDSPATNLLLLLWPHETRSITQVPRPAELWRSLTSQAISALDDPYALDDVADAAGRDLHWRALQVWLGWTWPGTPPSLQQVTASLRRLQQAAERACGMHPSPRH